ncbi:ABC transporter permease [Methylobacterium organophilum]|uniref:ABC transporter permease n=1 Tax=Methylobacterium organophilum TaxID=410 RepID=UPI001F140F50|nr:ABC transporter permease [Methylobacterium organophilum]UMY18333.1 ABC transporter permease [Methylobacterium organophilum]
MPRLVVRRLATFAVVLWAVYTLAFLMLYALPSDPVALMLERRSSGAGGSSPEQIELLRLRYGLNDPFWLRYLKGLGELLRGDLGTSFQSGRPVHDLLRVVAPNTLALAGSALALALPLALALGIATSWRRGSLVHRVLANLPALLAAVPVFWLGLLLTQLFAFQLRWLPSTGGSGLTGLVLPALTLALPIAALLTAVFVRSLDQVQEAPFVALLQARGLPWHRIYLAHVVRNALLPFVTLAGLMVGGALVGTVVTETVFSRAGLGRLFLSAVETRDAPVVLAITLLAALVFTAVNLAVDLLYARLDPRLRGRIAEARA